MSSLLKSFVRPFTWAAGALASTPNAAYSAPSTPISWSSAISTAHPSSSFLSSTSSTSSVSSISFLSTLSTAESPLSSFEDDQPSHSPTPLIPGAFPAYDALPAVSVLYHVSTDDPFVDDTALWGRLVGDSIPVTPPQGKKRPWEGERDIKAVKRVRFAPPIGKRQRGDEDEAEAHDGSARELKRYKQDTARKTAGQPAHRVRLSRWLKSLFTTRSTFKPNLPAVIHHRDSRAASPPLPSPRLTTSPTGSCLSRSSPLADSEEDSVGTPTPWYIRPRPLCGPYEWMSIKVSERRHISPEERAIRQKLLAERIATTQDAYWTRKAARAEAAKKNRSAEVEVLGTWFDNGHGADPLVPGEPKDDVPEAAENGALVVEMLVDDSAPGSDVGTHFFFEPPREDFTGNREKSNISGKVMLPEASQADPRAIGDDPSGPIDLSPTDFTPSSTATPLPALNIRSPTPNDSDVNNRETTAAWAIAAPRGFGSFSYSTSSPFACAAPGSSTNTLSIADRPANREDVTAKTTPTVVSRSPSFATWTIRPAGGYGLTNPVTTAAEPSADDGNPPVDVSLCASVPLLASGRSAVAAPQYPLPSEYRQLATADSELLPNNEMGSLMSDEPAEIDDTEKFNDTEGPMADLFVSHDDRKTHSPLTLQNIGDTYNASAVDLSDDEPAALDSSHKDAGVVQHAGDRRKATSERFREDNWRRAEEPETKRIKIDKGKARAINLPERDDEGVIQVEIEIAPSPLSPLIDSVRPVQHTSWREQPSTGQSGLPFTTYVGDAGENSIGPGNGNELVELETEAEEDNAQDDVEYDVKDDLAEEVDDSVEAGPAIPSAQTVSIGSNADNAARELEAYLHEQCGVECEAFLLGDSPKPRQQLLTPAVRYNSLIPSEHLEQSRYLLAANLEQFGRRFFPDPSHLIAPSTHLNEARRPLIPPTRLAGYHPGGRAVCSDQWQAHFHALHNVHCPTHAMLASLPDLNPVAYKYFRGNRVNHESRWASLWRHDVSRHQVGLWLPTVSEDPAQPRVEWMYNTLGRHHAASLRDPETAYVDSQIGKWVSGRWYDSDENLVNCATLVHSVGMLGELDRFRQARRTGRARNGWYRKRIGAAGYGALGLDLGWDGRTISPEEAETRLEQLGHVKPVDLTPIEWYLLSGEKDLLDSRNPSSRVSHFRDMVSGSTGALGLCLQDELDGPCEAGDVMEGWEHDLVARRREVAQVRAERWAKALQGMSAEGALDMHDPVGPVLPMDKAGRHGWQPVSQMRLAPPEGYDPARVDTVAPPWSVLATRGTRRQKRSEKYRSRYDSVELQLRLLRPLNGLQQAEANAGDGGMGDEREENDEDNDEGDDEAEGYVDLEEHGVTGIMVVEVMAPDQLSWRWDVRSAGTSENTLMDREAEIVHEESERGTLVDGPVLLADAGTTYGDESAASSPAEVARAPVNASSEASATSIAYNRIDETKGDDPSHRDAVDHPGEGLTLPKLLACNALEVREEDKPHETPGPNVSDSDSHALQDESQRSSPSRILDPRQHLESVLEYERHPAKPEAVREQYPLAGPHPPPGLARPIVSTEETRNVAPTPCYSSWTAQIGVDRHSPEVHEQHAQCSQLVAFDHPQVHPHLNESDLSLRTNDVGPPPVVADETHFSFCPSGELQTELDTSTNDDAEMEDLTTSSAAVSASEGVLVDHACHRGWTALLAFPHEFERTAHAPALALPFTTACGHDGDHDMWDDEGLEADVPATYAALHVGYEPNGVFMAQAPSPIPIDPGKSNPSPLPTPPSTPPSSPLPSPEPSPPPSPPSSPPTYRIQGSGAGSPISSWGLLSATSSTGLSPDTASSSAVSASKGGESHPDGETDYGAGTAWGGYPLVRRPSEEESWEDGSLDQSCNAHAPAAEDDALDGDDTLVIPPSPPIHLRPDGTVRRRFKRVPWSAKVDRDEPSDEDELDELDPALDGLWHITLELEAASEVPEPIAVLSDGNIIPAGLTVTPHSPRWEPSSPSPKTRSLTPPEDTVDPDSQISVDDPAWSSNGAGQCGSHSPPPEQPGRFGQIDSEGMEVDERPKGLFTLETDHHPFEPVTPLVDVDELAGMYTSWTSGAMSWRTGAEPEQMLALTGHLANTAISHPLRSIPEEGEPDLQQVLLTQSGQDIIISGQMGLPVDGVISLNSVFAAQIGQVPGIVTPAAGTSDIDYGVAEDERAWLLRASARDAAQLALAPNTREIDPGPAPLVHPTSVPLADADEPVENRANAVEVEDVQVVEPNQGVEETPEMEALIGNFRGSFTLQPQDELTSRALYALAIESLQVGQPRAAQPCLSFTGDPRAEDRERQAKVIGDMLSERMMESRMRVEEKLARRAGEELVRAFGHSAVEAKLAKDKQKFAEYNARLASGIDGDIHGSMHIDGGCGRQDDPDGDGTAETEADPPPGARSNFAPRKRERVQLRSAGLRTDLKKKGKAPGAGQPGTTRQPSLDLHGEVGGQTRLRPTRTPSMSVVAGHRGQSTSNVVHAAPHLSEDWLAAINAQMQLLRVEFNGLKCESTSPLGEVPEDQEKRPGDQIVAREARNAWLENLERIPTQEDAQERQSTGTSTIEDVHGDADGYNGGVRSFA